MNSFYAEYVCNVVDGETKSLTRRAVKYQMSQASKEI